MQFKIEKLDKITKDLSYEHKKEIDSLNEKMEFENNIN